MCTHVLYLGYIVHGILNRLIFCGSSVKYSLNTLDSVEFILYKKHWTMCSHSEPIQVYINVKVNNYKSSQGFPGDLQRREHFHAGQELKHSG